MAESTTATTTPPGRDDSLALAFVPTADLYDQHSTVAKVPTLPHHARWIHYTKQHQFGGVAVTVQCDNDNSRLKELVHTAGRRRVLVVDNGGSNQCAVVGDKIALSAERHNWAGLVVYGCVRDVTILATLERLGIVALGTTPRKTIPRDSGDINVPVTLGDVTVYPHEQVFVDDDGIVVLAPFTSHSQQHTA